MTWMLPSLCLDPPRPGLWVRDRCRCERCKTPAANEQANVFVFAGEALLESNTAIDFVYCSPALRCVQTAQNILKGKNRSVWPVPQQPHRHIEKVRFFFICVLG